MLEDPEAKTTCAFQRPQVCISRRTGVSRSSSRKAECDPTMLPVAREDVRFSHAHCRLDGVAAVRLRLALIRIKF
jgi:hypothetical protein